jgi:penicillin-binding protein 1A
VTNIKKEEQKASLRRETTQQFFVLKWFVIFSLWCGTFFSLYLLYVFRDLPSIDKLESVSRTRRVTILDNRDSILATYGDIYGYYVNYHEIPRNLRNAVLATEDRKFFNHFGIDVWGIIRAAFANFKAGRTVQGGSTITQQLAKIVFLQPKRNIQRKLQEALLAIELETKYTKEQIFAIYLNRVYLGSGLYGIDSAAKYYFGKNVQDLNLYESAIIAGLLKAPSKFSPTNNPELSGHRAYQVLYNMLEEGYINKNQIDQALSAPVILNTTMLGSVRRDYFTNWIYEQVDNYVSGNDQDVVVKTTLDSKIQNITRNIVNEQLKAVDEKRNVSQGASVILDRSGQILSMVGGKEYKGSSFNRVTQAMRQPGSAFKVFVYAAAMEKGYSPEDIIEDKAISYGTWSPKNFNKNFLGEITLEEAFAKSINTAAVQLANSVGIDNVIKTAHRMGIHSRLDQNLALALGVSSVTLLEITSSIGTIANNGYLVEPYAIRYIMNNKTGEFLYVRPASEQIRAISEDVTAKMQFLLQRAVEGGTARNVKSDFKISGKTGTSQDFRDAWFIGYTDKFLIGVWLGNDDYTPTKYVSGGTYPATIARDILRKIN